MNKCKLKDFTDTELLQELLTRNNPGIAPRKTVRQGVWFDSIIGIGNDHTASIYIDDDALRELSKINNI